MGYIRKRPLKKGGLRYQAEIRIKGHPTLTATFDRITDAKVWIQKMEVNIRCARHQLYLKNKKHLFSEAVEKYIRERTISVNKRGHLAWWKLELGSLYIQDIRPSIISEKKQKLLSETTVKGIVRCKSTCNRYLATLSHPMSIAYKQWEWVPENPVKKIDREKESRERTRFLSKEERHRLFDACKKSNNTFLFTFVVLLLSTGCRYNEIRSLKWCDINLEKGTITINQSKNGDVRSLPIRDLPLNLLIHLSLQKSSSSYIFPSKNKENPLELRRAFRTAIKRAGLKDFRGHDCRHSYATEMLGMGLSLGEIGHLPGHRSTSMTRRYAHLLESRSIDAVSRMSAQIF